MQLHDPRIELGREVRSLWNPVRSGRDDHVLRLEAKVARGDDEAAVDLGEPVDADARSHGKVEARGVRLQVVGQLVLRRERPGGCRDRHAGQAAEARGGEKAKRVPTLAPGVADPLVRVEDHERAILLREVVPGREAGLAAADDQGVEVL